MQEITKRKILFIINPISGAYRKKNIPELIARYLDFVQYDYTIRTTQYAGHATDIARQAAEEGYHVVVAVGGDGSINEVAQGLQGTSTALGIIPYGSGNGFARHLKIPPRDVKGALEVINTGKIVNIDWVHSNIRNFISNAGFGLDSAVARRFKHHGVRGFTSYAWAVLKEVLFYYEPMKTKVSIDDTIIERSFYLLTAFNANQYGYNFGVFPATSLRDGIMDIIVLNRFPTWKLPFIVFCLMLKRPDLIEEAECFRARRVEIEGTKKMVYQFDGDPVVYHENVVFEIRPECLRVIVPSRLNAY